MREILIAKVKKNNGKREKKKEKKKKMCYNNYKTGRVTSHIR